MIEQLRDSTIWLTLDRPERLNAVTVDDYHDLRVAVERATSDTAVRAIVLTGNACYEASAHRRPRRCRARGDATRARGDHRSASARVAPRLVT
jgi:enoyl-CoA hydratase/carnithine racemase